MFPDSNPGDAFGCLNNAINYTLSIFRMSPTRTASRRLSQQGKFVPADHHDTIMWLSWRGLRLMKVKKE